MSPNKKTQQDRILSLLRGREWVGLPEILGLYIASHTRRIHELRKRGFVIEMRDIRRGGVRHTAYKLVSEPPKYDISGPPKGRHFDAVKVDDLVQK